MPGEFEELRLQVTLQDDATPKLREIQRADNVVELPRSAWRHNAARS
jgi:hypothetical protein